MRSKVPPAPPAPSRAVGAVARQELVAQLLSHGHLVSEKLGGEEPLEEVVVAKVSLAPCEAERAGGGVRLEHGAHGVLGHPEPVLRRSVLGLEVERRERAPSARMRASTRSATAALSART